MPLWLKQDYTQYFLPVTDFFSLLIHQITDMSSSSDDVRTEATHTIRVDLEASIVFCTSYRRRIAIVSQTVPFVRAVLLVCKATSLNYYTYPFMVYYLYTIQSENCVCANIIVFICECLRYRLLVGPMWCDVEVVFLCQYAA